MLRHCAYIVTLVPSLLRWRLAETKPGARRTETSVASVRSSTSRRCLAGSTVNTLIRVITPFCAEIPVITSPSFPDLPQPGSNRRPLWDETPETGDLPPAPPWSRSCVLPEIARGQD